MFQKTDFRGRGNPIYTHKKGEGYRIAFRIKYVLSVLDIFYVATSFGDSLFIFR